MRKTFYEIFEEVEGAKTKADKIAVLKKHQSPALKLVLGLTYDPSIKWLLPEGAPPFKPLPASAEQEGGLVSELRRMYLFVEGNQDTQKNLKQHRREELFIDVLESIDPRDAKVLIGMKDRKLPFKSITRKLVAEAFPKMTANW